MTEEDRVLLPEVALLLMASSLKQRRPRRSNAAMHADAPRAEQTSLLVTEKLSTPKFREPCRCQLQYVRAPRNIARTFKATRCAIFLDPKSQANGDFFCDYNGEMVRL